MANPFVFPVGPAATLARAIIDITSGSSQEQKEPSLGVGQKRTLDTKPLSIDLPPQEPCDGSKPLVKTSLTNVAGLDLVDKERFLFVRDEVKEMWVSLEEHDDILIRGPPGTGKSSICWCWACYQANNQKTVLWLHLSRLKTMKQVHLTPTTVHYGILHPHDIIGSIERYTGDILILDGITEKDRQDRVTNIAYIWKAISNQRKIVLVTSNQIKYGIEDLKLTHVINHPSWTLEQFKEACAIDEFYKCIATYLDKNLDKDEAIERKFSLTGGSARWMFGFNEEDTEEDIKTLFDKIPSMDLIAQGLTGHD